VAREDESRAAANAFERLKARGAGLNLACRTCTPPRPGASAMVNR